MSGTTVPNDSLQLQILKALAAHLEGIEGIPLLGGGTATLAGKVYRGRTVFGDEVSTPFLSILEARKPDDANSLVTGEDNLQRYEDWHLLIQGFLGGDPANPTDLLYNFKALVEQRLAVIVALSPRGDAAFPQFYRLGNLIPDLKISPGVIRPVSPTVGMTECFFLPITLLYSIDMANPFSVSN